MLARQVLKRVSKSVIVSEILHRNANNNVQKYCKRTISSAHGIPTSKSSKGYNYLTLGQLLDNAVDKSPDRIVIHSQHQDISKTYLQFHEDVDKLALALHRIGIGQSDNVGIWAVNSYEWVTVQFATAKLGAKMITINPGYRERELRDCLNLVKVKLLIANQSFKSSNYVQILQSVSPNIFHNAQGHCVHSDEIPTLKHIVFFDQPQEIAPSNITRFSELLRLSETPGGLTYPSETVFDDVINVQFTSGTTGSPKGAMLTHFNIMQNVNFVTPKLFESYFDDEKPIVCISNPLYHCFGCVIGTASVLFMNGTIVLPSPVHASQESLKAIQRYGCNFFYGTPTMWTDFLNASKGRESMIKTLKRGVMAGAPCPPALLKKVMSEMKNLENILTKVLELENCHLE